jgi:hypothetical protein
MFVRPPNLNSLYNHPTSRKGADIEAFLIAHKPR